jgi:isopenicillin N synthase-like dioxygenase
MRLFLLLITYISLCSDELDIRIPVIDMQEINYDTLYEAMTTVGFFAVRHTGIDAATVREAYAQAEAFFKQDSDYKMKCFLKDSGGQRGFVPGETAKGNAVKDRKEFYHIGRETSLPANIWPEEPSFKNAMVTLFTELEQYVVPLQRAIIETINQRTQLKVDPDFLNHTTKTGDSLLRALYYPLFPELKPIYWAAPHTDIDYLAILPYATEKGLQVEVDGQWLNVVVPDDAFIVNIGDMLENLSNGLFISAKHRVVAQETNKERFSMVLFVHPDGNTPLDPLSACIELTGGTQLYAPGTRNEFLWERLLELNIAPGLLEPYSQTGHTERQIQYGRQSPQVVDMLIKHGLSSPEVLQAQ